MNKIEHAELSNVEGRYDQNPYVPGPNPGCNCDWCQKIARGEVNTDKSGRFVRTKGKT